MDTGQVEPLVQIATGGAGTVFLAGGTHDLLGLLVHFDGIAVIGLQGDDVPWAATSKRAAS